MDGKQNTGATQEVIMSSSVQRFRELQHHISKNCAIPVFVRIRNMRSSVSFRGRVTSSSTRPRHKVENSSILMIFGDPDRSDPPTHLDETAGNNIDTLCHGGDVLAVGDSFYDT